MQVLLDQCALVVARTRQPDVMHVVVGEGHDGKTLVFVDHMRAVFGSGFGNCPCSMLQVEREFQVQGSNFVDAVWMACDEARRQQGVCEDLMKNYIGGGWLPLRKNHAQETTYGCWRYAGKVWCMNTADIPEIPTSEERSNARIRSPVRGCQCSGQGVCGGREGKGLHVQRGRGVVLLPRLLVPSHEEVRSPGLQ